LYPAAAFVFTLGADDVEEAAALAKDIGAEEEEDDEEEEDEPSETRPVVKGSGFISWYGFTLKVPLGCKVFSALCMRLGSEKMAKQFSSSIHWRVYSLGKPVKNEWIVFVKMPLCKS